MTLDELSDNEILCLRCYLGGSGDDNNRFANLLRGGLPDGLDAIQSVRQKELMDKWCGDLTLKGKILAEEARERDWPDQRHALPAWNGALDRWLES